MSIAQNIATYNNTLSTKCTLGANYTVLIGRLSSLLSARRSTDEFYKWQRL